MPLITTGHLWIVLLLIVVLVIFGPKRLPELGSSVGKALREFRKATSELRDQVSESAAPSAPSESTTENTRPMVGSTPAPAATTNPAKDEKAQTEI